MAFGNATILGGSNRATGILFDRMAVHGDELMAVSLIAPVARVKQIFAILNSSRFRGSVALGYGSPVPERGDGLNFRRSPKSIFAGSDRYTMETHRLPYAQAHAVIMTKRPGFLVNLTSESLWQELNGPRYTTPILREWMPEIEKSLRAANLLTDCFCFGCRCGFLDATTTDLDTIVSQAIRMKKIQVPVSRPASDSVRLDTLKTLADYIDAYGSKLAAKAIGQLSPLHVPGRDPLPDFSPIIAHNPGREPIPAQAHCIAAGIAMFDHQGSGFLSGEPGSGKTIMGIASVHFHATRSRTMGGRSGRYRALVFCPDILIEKWKREILDTIPGARVTTFDRWSDVVALSRRGNGQRWTRPEGPEWYVVGRDQSKWMPDWRPIGEGGGRSVASRFRMIEEKPKKDEFGATILDDDGDPVMDRTYGRVFTCPECGRFIENARGIPISADDLARSQKKCESRSLQPIPNLENGEIKDTAPIFPVPREYLSYAVGSEFDIEGKGRYRVTECNAPLWHWTHRPRRWSPAVYIQKHLHRFFHYMIADECFPGNTPVSTPTGSIPISLLMPGDIVRSWDGRSVVNRRVVRLIRKKSGTPMVKIVHSRGELVCTQNHKIYTMRGKVKAIDLTNQDIITGIDDEVQSIRTAGNCDPGKSDLSDLRDDVRRRFPTTQQEILFETLQWGPGRNKDHQAVQGMRQRIQVGTDQETGILLEEMFLHSSMERSGIFGESSREDGQEIRSSTVGCQRTNETNESDFGISRASSDFFRESERKAILWNPGRQRYAFATTDSLDGPYRVRHGISRSDGRPIMEIAGMRSCQSGTQDCRRIGRIFASNQDSERERFEEGPEVSGTRLDRPSFSEFGSRQQSRIGDPCGSTCSRVEVESVELIQFDEEFVYDIEVEDTHNYFSDGILVSNCHEFKSDSSAQSLAVGKVIGSVKHTLAMTGTVIGGYANHLYPLLFRICGKELRREGFEWSKDLAFSEKYGRIDRIVTTKEDGVQSSTEASVKSLRKAITGRSTQRKAVRPGIMPTLFSRHMMGNAIFISLDQMADSLPKFVEYYGSIVAEPDDPYYLDTGCDMASAQRAENDRVVSALESRIKQLMKSGQHMKLLSTYLHTALDFPDRPFGWGHDEEVASAYYDQFDAMAAKVGHEAARQLIGIPHTVGYWDLPGSRRLINWRGVVTPQDCNPAVVYPKEQKLIEICRREKMIGSQVWIYLQMTNKRDIQDRLRMILESDGFKVGVLRSRDVSVREREAWIADHGPRYDVMISHPQLVSTGIELFGSSHNYSSLIFYQTGYNPFTMMQAARRAWRIGQTRACRVYYLYYRGTMQERAIKLMSLKTMAARSLDGRLSPEGLAALTGGQNIQMQLARSMADRIPDAVLARRWKKIHSMARTA